MAIVLLLIAIVLTVVASFVSDNKEERAKLPETSNIVAMVATTAVFAYVIASYGPAKDRMGLEVGLIVGAVATLASAFLGGKIAPIGLGVAAACALHLVGPSVTTSAQLALLCGGTIGALTLRRDGALATSLIAAGCVAADFLGSFYSSVPNAAMFGSILGLAGLVGAIVSAAVPTGVSVLRPVAIGLVTTVGGYFATRMMGDWNLPLVVTLGSAAGIVVHFLVPEDEKDATRLTIASVIAVSIATITFGLAKGTGMALSLGAMTIILLGCGNRVGVLAIGPLFGLVLYRFLKQVDFDSTKALDIGQHYALLGVILGAAIPLLPANWNYNSSLKNGLGAFLWAILVLSSPIFIAVMLGEKGSVGFVGGLGLAGLCQALRGERSLLPLSIAPGLASVTILCLNWFNDWADLARDEKVKIFTIGGVALVVIAIALGLIARPSKQEVAK